MGRRVHAGAAVAVVVGLLTSGCFGPFNLTRRVYHWNDTVSQGKWEKEIVFLLLTWVPIYGLATLADGLVFNSFEFWTGNNPVDPPTARREAVQTTRIVRGTDEAVLSSDGRTLAVEQFQRGRPAGSLRVIREGDRTMGYGPDGAVRFSASTAADGSITVADAQGQPVATYSARDVRAFERSQIQ